MKMNHPDDLLPIHHRKDGDTMLLHDRECRCGESVRDAGPWRTRAKLNDWQIQWILMLLNGSANVPIGQQTNQAAVRIGNHGGSKRFPSHFNDGLAQGCR